MSDIVTRGAETGTGLRGVLTGILVVLPLIVLAGRPDEAASQIGDGATLVEKEPQGLTESGPRPDAGTAPGKDIQGVIEYSMMYALAWPGAWDNAVICLTEAGGPSPDKRAAGGFVRLTTQESVGDVPAPRELVLPPGALEQVLLQQRLPYHPVAGDVVLLWCSADSRRPDAISAFAVARTERERWLSAIRSIRAFRQAITKEERAEAGEGLLRGPWDLSILYLGRLLEDGATDVPARWKALLLAARDNEKLLLQTRLLMSLALHRHEKTYKEQASHLKWVRQWFAKAADFRSDEWTLLLEHLGRYADPADIERSDLPKLMELVRCPQTDSREKGAIVDWFGRALGDWPTANETVTEFLLNETLSAPQMVDQTLSAIAGGIGNLVSKRLRSPRNAEDLEIGVKKLRAYKTMLVRLSEKAGPRRQSYIRHLIVVCEMCVKKYDPAEDG